MTVRELIKKLQQHNPNDQVLLRFERYTSDRTSARVLEPVSHPIDYVTLRISEPAILLVADQKGDYH